MTINKQAKLLVVDDEPINLRILHDMLGDEYEIAVALDGDQALKRALTTLPDLILLDIQMSNMDGYEVCRLLKFNPSTRDIPIIFVTSKTDEEDEIRGLELGAVDYITKPYRMAIMKARLRNHMELKRQRDLLNHLSCQDGLTEVANRRKLEQFLDQEWRNAIRYKSEIALIFIDIDHFKSFNDNHGHQAGDDCLKMIANTLKKIPGRSIDMFARFGGEEFVCVLPKTNLKGAVQIAEKMREAMRELAIPHFFSKTSSRVTLSFGVAVATPENKESSYTDLIAAADKMLYIAKAKGRNCVAFEE